MAHSVDKTKQIENMSNGLDMTGKSVLVQSGLGIFYGTLEKADTRSGTALLRNGFMISSDRHITFIQYLDFLATEANAISCEFGKHFDDDGEPDIDASELEIGDEIQIKMNDFVEHSRRLNITDYASDGIFLVQFRTSNYCNTNYHQSVVKLISLTGVSAIVPVNSDKYSEIEHEEFEIAKYGEVDSLSPYPLENLFHNKIEDVHITPEDTFHYMLFETSNALMGEVVKMVEKGEGDKQISANMLNPLGLADNKKLPRLVVNTEQRIEAFKKLKKAQLDEQVK